jgi:hypothetical protein
MRWLLRRCPNTTEMKPSHGRKAAALSEAYFDSACFSLANIARIFSPMRRALSRSSSISCGVSRFDAVDGSVVGFGCFDMGDSIAERTAKHQSAPGWRRRSRTFRRTAPRISPQFSYFGCHLRHAEAERANRFQEVADRLCDHRLDREAPAPESLGASADD